MNINDIPDEEVIRFAETCLTHPPDSMFYNQDLFWSWGLTPFVQTRDSGTLEQSNYTSILRDLSEKYPDDISDMRASHWAFGWIEHITVRVLKNPEDWRPDLSPTSNHTGRYLRGALKKRAYAAMLANITDAVRDVILIAGGLQDYPSYDDELLSELELKERDEAFDNAWSSLMFHWDEDSDGPSPTDEEKEFTYEQLSGNEDSSYGDEDTLREIMDDKRLADTLAQYENPGQTSLREE